MSAAFIDDHHDKTGVSEDDSGDDTSTDDDPEIEPMEIQEDERSFALNPYKHYLDTGDIAPLHNCRPHLVMKSRTQFLWAFE